jgi:hypothetical protein
MTGTVVSMRVGTPVVPLALAMALILLAAPATLKTAATMATTIPDMGHVCPVTHTAL